MNKNFLLLILIDKIKFLFCILIQDLLLIYSFNLIINLKKELIINFIIYYHIFIITGLKKILT